jgi:outer membrane protein OmpA-like peptidoglycan-associated protein
MVLILISSAFGQDVTAGGDVPTGLNSQTFRPSVDAQRTLWTDETLLAPSGVTTARFLLSYANNPLVYVDALGERMELVSDLYQLDLLGAHTRGPLRFGLDVPIYLRSSGDQTGGETGLGDVSALVRLTALDRRSAPLGAALSFSAILPTSTVEAPLGSGGFAWEASAIVDKELGKALLALNLGHRSQPDVSLENLTWSDQLAARAGVGYALSPSSGLSADASTVLTYSGEPAGRASEVLFGGYRRTAEKWMLRAALGTGLNTAVGTARLRAVFAVAYEPDVADRDRDGVFDSVDACPDTPEDIDSVADDDGCPEPTMVMLSFVDVDGAPVDGVPWRLGDSAGSGAGSAELFGGPYPLTVTLDGYEPISRTEQIPDVAQHDLVVTMDAFGLPGTLLVSALDSNGDDIEGADWLLRGTDYTGFEVGTPVEVPSGSYTLIVRADGYTPVRQAIDIEYQSTVEVVLALEETEIVVTQEQIDINDSIYFETDKSVIRADSHALLDDVAAILVAHPEITRLRIEGHTDSRGAADYNRTLSQTRAESVRTYLIARGVESERLDAEGFGEDRPLVRGNSESAWSKNRRVDFMVVERTE